MVSSQVPVYTRNGQRVYLLPSLVIMTLQSDIQERKKLGSHSFHTTKPLHSVPANPDDWNNIQTAVGSLAE